MHLRICLAKLILLLISPTRADLLIEILARIIRDGPSRELYAAELADWCAGLRNLLRTKYASPAEHRHPASTSRPFSTHQATTAIAMKVTSPVVAAAAAADGAGMNGLATCNAVITATKMTTRRGPAPGCHRVFCK